MSGTRGEVLKGLSVALGEGEVPGESAVVVEVKTEKVYAMVHIGKTADNVVTAFLKERSAVYVGDQSRVLFRAKLKQLVHGSIVGI